jgi:hypothetical protein
MNRTIQNQLQKIQAKMPMPEEACREKTSKEAPEATLPTKTERPTKQQEDLKTQVKERRSQTIQDALAASQKAEEEEKNLQKMAQKGQNSAPPNAAELRARAIREAHAASKVAEKEEEVANESGCADPAWEVTTTPPPKKARLNILDQTPELQGTPPPPTVEEAKKEDEWFEPEPIQLPTTPCAAETPAPTPSATSDAPRKGLPSQQPLSSKEKERLATIIREGEGRDLLESLARTATLRTANSERVYLSN